MSLLSKTITYLLLLAFFLLKAIATLIKGVFGDATKGHNICLKIMDGVKYEKFKVSYKR